MTNSPGTTVWAALIVGVVAWVGCTADASPTSTSLSLASTGSMVWRPAAADEPIFVAFEARTGYSPWDLVDIRNVAIEQRVAACMADGGFQYTPPSPVNVDALLDGVEIGLVAQTGLDLIAASQIPVRATPSAQSTPEQRAAQRCRSSNWIGSTDDYYFVVSELLSAATVEAASQTASSGDYLAAKEQFQRCVGNLGPAEDATTEAQKDDEAALQILLSLGEGRLTEEQAVEQLTSIATRRLDQAGALRAAVACEAPFVATERALYYAGQQRYLDEHPQFIDGVAETFEQLIEESISG